MTKLQLIRKFFNENEIGFSYTIDEGHEYPALFDTKTGEEIINLQETLDYFSGDFGND